MENYTNRMPTRKGGHNSRFSIETLLIHLLNDLGTSKGLPISDNDISTLTRRIAAEGPQYAYKTLASIQDALLTLLEFGTLPPEFASSRLPESRIPKFLGNLWKSVMDSDGRLLPDIENSYAAIQSVAGLLQVSTAFSKYSDSAPWDRIPEYCEEFVAMDAALSDLSFPRALISAAANVITTVFDRFSLENIIPRHGPGAVATGERAEGKWSFNQLILSAEPFYPFHEYFVAGTGLMDPFQLVDLAKSYWDLTKVNTGTAKVVFVEKTALKLRTISMEPLGLQFLQQGQMTKMVTLLQAHPLTRGHVNFDDQMINRNLALVHSSTRSMATLDLSAASDRLSLDLVKALFTNVEENVLRWLLATRSSHTVLPNGVRLELRKFAPMGSAVCFPVQSICFYALCVASIMLAQNIPLHVAAKKVYVFGDDLVVPVEGARSVMDALESVGLKVNRAKSFVRGHFRESCGMFAFAGVDVTPLRFKTSFPRTRGDGRAIASWLSYAHDCGRRGYGATADYIYTLIEDLIGELPYGLPGCGYFCRLALSEFDLARHLSRWKTVRWNEGLQRLEIKALGLHTPFRDVDFKTPWAQLLRDLLTDYSESDPSKAVGRSAKPKPAWHPVV